MDNPIFTFREARNDNSVMESVYLTLYDHGMEAIKDIFDHVVGGSLSHIATEREKDMIHAILKSEEVATGKWSKENDQLIKND